jgi:hypothetical protein
VDYDISHIYVKYHNPLVAEEKYVKYHNPLVAEEKYVKCHNPLVTEEKYVKYHNPLVAEEKYVENLIISSGYDMVFNTTFNNISVISWR